MPHNCSRRGCCHVKVRLEDMPVDNNFTINCITCGGLVYRQPHASGQPEPDYSSAHHDTAYSNPVYDSILHEAHMITDGARQQDYGSARESFSRIAMIANVAIGRNLTLKPTDIVKVLMAVKLVRESFKHKRDNLVDLCGYARLLQDIEDDLANMEPNCKPANS